MAEVRPSREACARASGPVTRQGELALDVVHRVVLHVAVRLEELAVHVAAAKEKDVVVLFTGRGEMRGGCSRTSRRNVVNLVPISATTRLRLCYLASLGDHAVDDAVRLEGGALRLCLHRRDEEGDACSQRGV